MQHQFGFATVVQPTLKTAVEARSLAALTFLEIMDEESEEDAFQDTILEHVSDDTSKNLDMCVLGYCDSSTQNSPRRTIQAESLIVP